MHFSGGDPRAKVAGTLLSAGQAQSIVRGKCLSANFRVGVCTISSHFQKVKHDREMGQEPYFSAFYHFQEVGNFVRTKFGHEKFIYFILISFRRI